jgi:hypothetical protein
MASGNRHAHFGGEELRWECILVFFRNISLSPMWRGPGCDRAITQSFRLPLRTRFIVPTHAKARFGSVRQLGFSQTLRAR